MTGNEKDLAELISEIRAQLALISYNLPSVVDPAGISLVAKIPYKVLTFREALLWRTEELARTACEMFERSELASAILLTRGVSENAAILWYLHELVAKNTGSVEPELDDRVMRLLMGSRNNEEMPQAIQILAAVDKADKKIPGTRRSYDRLSEYAHPNWSGVAFLFSHIDHDEILTRLGRNPRALEGPARMGLGSLQGALRMFEFAYNTITDNFPKFVAACEDACQRPE